MASYSTQNIYFQYFTDSRAADSLVLRQEYPSRFRGTRKVLENGKMKFNFTKRGYLAGSTLGLALLAPQANAAIGFTAADTYVSNSAAESAQSFGSEAKLLIGAGKTAYVRFDLSSLPPNTQPGDIAKASLVFYVNGIAVPGSINIAPATNDWSEASANFNSRPSSGPAVWRVSTRTANAFYSQEITEQVQAWVAGQNQGLQLSSEDGSFSLDAKESQRNSVYLDIVLNSRSRYQTPGNGNAYGNDGEKGDKGDKGDKGEKGDDGAKGLKGDKGDDGAKGLKGDKGDKGNNGDNGVRGDKGDKGSNGDKGDKGDKGDNGAKGDKGDNGVRGDKGDKGDKGDRGDNGNHGLKGDTGETGAQGPQGATGAAGPQGETGATGATGSQGAKGDKGDKGDRGEKGDSVQGAKGDTGATGAQGPRGPQGQDGMQGPQGPMGPAGPAGVVIVYDASGNPQRQSHIVTGVAQLDLGSWTVRLSNGAVFTSASSYVCNATQIDGRATLKIVYESGAQFRVSSDTDDRSTASFTYMCTGY